MNDGGVTSETGAAIPTASTQQQQQQPQAFVLQPHLFLSLPLVVFVLVLLIRAMPWSEQAQARKPLSCDVCLASWCSFAVGIGLTWLASAHWSWTLLHMLPAPGAAILLLALHKWMTAPRELPLPPPPER